MSFVSLGGDGSTRPTFFELVAAERLMPSLKAATIYSLSVCPWLKSLKYALDEHICANVAAARSLTDSGIETKENAVCTELDLAAVKVFAQRRPLFHRFLDFEDEVFALISIALDKQTLANGSASFADTLYGLRRARYTASAQREKQPTLPPRDQQLTLLCLVGLPYVKAKLQKLYDQHRGRADRLLGLTLLPRLTTVAAPTDGSPADRLHRLTRGCRQWLLALFLRIYPWVNGATEGLHFVYQLLYLLDSSPYYTPVLHLLRQHIVRVSGQELVDVERAKQTRRRQQLRRATSGSSWLLGILRSAILKAGYAFTDHTRNILILSVFAFKLLEWWYTSGEQKLASNKKLPVPPPPPAPLPADGGVPLPEDPSLCPLCRQKRTNPAMAVPSGYIFCYPCIFNHVSEFGNCPITQLSATVDQIRRLYQSQ